MEARLIFRSPSSPGLPTTTLALYLEERVNNFLRAEDADAHEVTIRIVSSSDKILDARMLMKERFQEEFPNQFPYRTKAMFVFEEIDGVDVCFFGMHVQEYGSDCQAPNTRWVGLRTGCDVILHIHHGSRKYVQKYSDPFATILIVNEIWLVDQSNYVAKKKKMYVCVYT